MDDATSTHENLERCGFSVPYFEWGKVVNESELFEMRTFGELAFVSVENLVLFIRHFKLLFMI